MSARLAAASEPFSDAIQRRLDKVMPPGIPPLRLFTTLARDERLFERFFAAGLLDRGTLSLREREIVIDRTTALCGSEYEWGVHIALFAARAGFTEEQIYALVHGQSDVACWNAAERTLIQMCDSLHHGASLTDELWSALRAHFSEEAILELLLLSGHYRTVSYLTNVLRLPLEPYSATFPALRGSSQEEGGAP
jgi:alkylhydroperoxidase family enzyme